MNEDAYAYWLHNVPLIGNKTALMLVKKYKSAKAVYHMPPEKLGGCLSEKQREEVKAAKLSWDLTAEYEKMTEKGIRMVRFGGGDYPKRLKEISSPPFVLYYRGSLPKEDTLSLAVIGARECSEYGKYIARAFAGQAAAEGINIISGMARGIDGIGQQAAVEALGKSYAVLGCGVDICYPKENRKLYDILQKQGGILSPYPPGMKPAKTMFPYRNEIVAGLSDAVLVVEARQKSGTLITVDMALEQGKDVYAVPGRLTDRLSDGCNYLIRQGAGIALTPEDVLLEMRLLKGVQAMTPQSQEKQSSGPPQDILQGEEGLLRFLDFYPRSSDEIYEKMLDAGVKITLSEMMCELIRLCVSGRAKQIEGNCFVKGTK